MGWGRAAPGWSRSHMPHKPSPGNETRAGRGMRRDSLRRTHSRLVIVKGNNTEQNGMHVRTLRICCGCPCACRNAHTSATTPRKRKFKPSCSTEPKLVTPMQQVREFPREELTHSASNLFCNACREKLSLKLSIIKLHITSGKHLAGKEALARIKAWECDIAKSLELYDKQKCPSGQNLPEAQRKFIVKVVRRLVYL